jgi:DNA repair protein RecN (Recombination protein N)
MLSELRIQNLLLIASAHIEFVGGLNAFTGETGAGKSLLVDALGFLLGARGDANMVRPGTEQAEVSARFFISDSSLVESLAHDLGVVFDAPDEEHAELVLNRTIPRSGRARAHANGRPIALPALRELGERLLDIHGQHENQSLLRPATRLEILDRYAQALSERAAVRRAWSDALAAAQALAELRRAARDRQGREDTMRFQLKELEDARLEDLDPGSLENEVRLLKGAERIGAAAAAARAALDGDDGESAATLIARALKQFSALGEAGNEAASLAARLEGILAEAREAARDADHLAEKARSDPQRLADLEESRNRLRTLERKHGRDLPGLRDLRVKLRAELADLQEIDVRTEEREAALASSLQALRNAAAKLSRKRDAAGRKLEKAVNSELSSLGLKDARLQIALNAHQDSPAQTDPSELDPADTEAHRLLPAQIKPTGAESVEILFSANPDLARQPLKDCASGGEISRVMLALKGVLARAGGADRLPVVVFDEVDSGVGGRMGAVLGKKLADLARVRQVLCVTHQPQIAVYAQRQLKVEKSRSGGTTVISVEAVEGDKRIDELALMLRGGSASAHTRAEAVAMLKEARSGS